MPTFRYFPGYPEGAPFAEGPCYFCGSHPAIDGMWLGFDKDFDDPPPVCIQDLIADKARVDIADWIWQLLARNVEIQHPDWTAQTRQAYVEARTYELAHTPPVPWIQNNEWPVCADDYASFTGELTREKLEAHTGGAEGGKALLLAIMRQERPDWPIDVQLNNYWEYLGDFMRIYQFRCPDGSEVNVLQMM